MGRYRAAAKMYADARRRQEGAVEGHSGEDVTSAVNIISAILNEDNCGALELIKQAVGDEGIHICNAEGSHDLLCLYFISPKGIVMRFTRDGQRHEEVKTVLDLVTAMLRRHPKTGLTLKSPQEAVDTIRKYLENLIMGAPRS